MKSLLVLDTSSDPYKKKFLIQNNTLVIKTSTPRNIQFQKILFHQNDISHYILYDSVLSFAENNFLQSLVVFNGNCNLDLIVQLIRQIAQLTVFKNKKAQLAQFEVRKSQVYDFNRNPKFQQKSEVRKSWCQQIYDMESLREDHCIYLKQYEDIQKQLIFNEIDEKKLKKMCSNNASGNFNKFFILRIEDNVKFIILNIDHTVTTDHISHKQITQLKQFLLFKKHHPNNTYKFTTTLVALLSIITSTIDYQQHLNYLITYYPANQEHLNIAYDLAIEYQQLQLNKILYEEESQKACKVQSEILLLQEKINQLRVIRRIEEQKAATIMSKCKKTVQKLAEGLLFLSKNGIKNLTKHTDWLQCQIQKKKCQLEKLQQELKSLNTQLINSSQNQQCFYDKMLALKQKLMLKSKEYKIQSLKKQNDKLTVQNNKIEQQKIIELQMIRQKAFNQLQNRINELDQKKQFLRLLKLIKQKVSQKEYLKICKKYQELLHE